MNFDETLIVLSETRQHDLTTRFKRESDAFYLEAKRSVVATQARIPVYVYLFMRKYLKLMVYYCNQVFILYITSCVFTISSSSCPWLERVNVDTLLPYISNLVLVHRCASDCHLLSQSLWPIGKLCSTDHVRISWAWTRKSHGLY